MYIWRVNKSYKVKDPYFLRAKKLGYRARSAFKLLDIQKKFRLILQGDSVIDLGAAPGSFMQVILELVGEQGKVLGVDLQAIEPLDRKNAFFIQGDIFHTEPLLKAMHSAGFEKVDVVTSDLAPKTSGVRDLDQGRSVELTEQAYLLSKKLLKNGGHFVGKVFMGEDLQNLLKEVKKDFKTVSLFKPPSCRDRSFETYIVAMHMLKSAHED